MTAIVSQFISKLKGDKAFQLFLWILFYIFIFLLLLNNSYQYLDPDLGWHLRVGEAIASSGEVPRANLYNYTFIGNWVDHEWLGDLWLYKIYASLGYLAVSTLFSFIVLAALVLLHFEIKRYFPKASPVAIIFFQVLGVVAALPSLGVRLQVLGLFFVVLTLTLISAYDRKRDWRLTLFWPPLFYLWASLHASFLLGLGLLVAWFFIRAVERLAGHFKITWLIFGQGFKSTSQFIISAAAIVASFLATSLTPYRWELYSFLLGYRDSFYQMHIREWLPQHVFPLQYMQLFYMALVATIVFLYIYYFRRLNKGISLWEIFLVVIFIFLSWQSRRHFPLLVFVTMPFVIFYGQSLINEGGTSDEWRLPSWLKFFIILCLLLSSASLLAQIRAPKNPFLSFCQDYPCQAVEFLKNRPDLDGYRLFNDYGWGGYLIWSLPGRLLFIDGRLPQKEFAGHTFLQEYYEFFEKDTDIESKLDEYNIGLVLIPAHDKSLAIRWWEKILFSIKDQDIVARNYLRQYLEASGWPVLYTDQVSVIYANPLMLLAN